MLSILYVGLALSNAISSNLGATTNYLYSARMQYTGEWQVQCYDNANHGYFTYEFSLNFHEYLQFNNTNDYRIIMESYSLYTKVSYYVYENNTWELNNSDWYNDTINLNITFDDYTDMSKFYVRPASTPQGLFIYLRYDVTDIGHYSLPDYYYDIDVFYPVKFDDSSLFYNNSNYINGVIASQNYYDGYDNGYRDGVTYGYQDGYTDGFDNAFNQNTTAATIFTGILEVGLLPINVFLTIFNYEVFGINISGLVSSLLTVAIIVIIIRVILSKSGGGGSK